MEFELDGQPFTALNGGPQFTFTEAVSVQVICDSQQEIDHYWTADAKLARLARSRGVGIARVAPPPAGHFGRCSEASVA